MKTFITILIITFGLRVYGNPDDIAKKIYEDQAINELSQHYIDAEHAQEANEKKNNSEDEFKRPYIAISLGDSCKVALHLSYFKVSEYAFPLNWMIVPFDGLYKLFENDFIDFFEKENLVDHGAFVTKETRNILDKEYNILSVHDFPKVHPFEAYVRNTDNVYGPIKEKFERRIERLYRALNSNKLVYLMRSAITKSETQELADLINSKFPSLNYILVAIGGTEEFKESWNLPHIKNFYLPNYVTNFFDPEGWKFIFEELGLISTTFSSAHTLETIVNAVVPYG